METVAMDEKKKMLIQVTPDPNHKSDAYLKLYNSLYSPTYVLHKHVERMAEKDDWFLTAKEKTDFIEFLKSHTKHEPLYTVWQKTILAYNKELDLFEEQTKENLLPNLKHPDFLPFNLPIPNYSYL